MNQQELSKAKDQDLIASMSEMKRAAALARKIAIQTGTDIVMVKNQKLVRVTAETLRNQGMNTEDGN